MLKKWFGRIYAWLYMAEFPTFYRWNTDEGEIGYDIAFQKSIIEFSRKERRHLSDHIYKLVYGGLGAIHRKRYIENGEHLFISTCRGRLKFVWSYSLKEKKIRVRSAFKAESNVVVRAPSALRKFAF